MVVEREVGWVAEDWVETVEAAAGAAAAAAERAVVDYSVVEAAEDCSKVAAAVDCLAVVARPRLPRSAVGLLQVALRGSSPLKPPRSEFPNYRSTI